MKVKGFPALPSQFLLFFKRLKTGTWFVDGRLAFKLNYQLGGLAYDKFRFRFLKLSSPDSGASGHNTAICDYRVQHSNQTC